MPQPAGCCFRGRPLWPADRDSAPVQDGHIASGRIANQSDVVQAPSAPSFAHQSTHPHRSEALRSTRSLTRAYPVHARPERRPDKALEICVW